MRAAVLCPSLPFSSRMNILQSFNQSLFELLIATDEFLEKEGEDDDDEKYVEEEKEEPFSRRRKPKFKVNV